MDKQVNFYCIIHFNEFTFNKYYFFLFLFLNFFNWRLITLQCCGGFCHTLMNIINHLIPSIMQINMVEGRNKEIMCLYYKNIIRPGMFV